MHLVLEIVFIYELLWDHGYMYHYIICSIHVVIEVEIFDVHAHVSRFDVGDGDVYTQFHCG